MITIKEDITAMAITREDLLRLSQYHNTSCISIYIPTHRHGVETLNGQDSLNLKNQVKEIRAKLASQGLTPRKIESLVNPVAGLIENSDFWRHQSDGLAVFVAENVFEKYLVPERLGGFNYISSEFYLAPLIPLFNITGTFHLLSLKKDSVRLHEGNKYGLTEIDITNIAPQQLEDSVGYDFEQKQLQHRTLMGGNKPGTFHGHSESDSKNKVEMLLFFREIDKGIMSILHNKQESPLVVCCLDYYMPLYREATTHKNLFQQHISFDPASLDTKSLHEKAWEILEPHFASDLEERKARFPGALGKGKASSNVREIIPAAVQGKIDTLFIERNAEVYGIYDLTANSVIIDEKHEIANVSLINLAAKKVFEQGGTVYILDRNQMPDGLEYISALFRY
jgi:hypothetical protein